MSAREILDQLSHLSPVEIEAVRRSLESLPSMAAVREIPGRGIRPPDYEELFGSLATDPPEL